ncbi:MAG TPA: hypothetical protein VG389_10240, partial [Myxococcota bacterium]|nr:hypothetical protein [Myxococcota bacterium]
MLTEPAHDPAKRARTAAEEFAGRQRGEGYGLDFSEASVRVLERVVDAHAELRVPESYGELRAAPAAALDFVARAGAYLGEVARRHRGGSWAAGQSGAPFPVLRDAAGRPGQVFDPFRVIFDAVGAKDGGIVVARYMMMGGRVPDPGDATDVT